jgi:hypothetical protein
VGHLAPFLAPTAPPLTGPGKAAESTDDPAVPSAELPKRLSTALPVVKAAAAERVSLIYRMAEASDESGYATPDDVFADLLHRPGCLAGTAARIPGAVPGSRRWLRSGRRNRIRSVVLSSAASHQSEDHCHRSDPRQGSASCFAHGETVVLARNLLPHLGGCAMLDETTVSLSYGLKGRSGRSAGIGGARSKAVFGELSSAEIGWNLWGTLPHFLPQDAAPEDASRGFIR